MGEGFFSYFFLIDSSKMLIDTSIFRELDLLAARRA
jgi:hypothetical protein